MRYRLLAIATVALGCRSAAERSAQLFTFGPDDAASITEFQAEYVACQQASSAFKSLTLSRPETSIPLRLVHGSMEALIGSPDDSRTGRPVLTIDLDDLMRLPTADAIAHWPGDSNWAFTRCEALGHELAEAIEYSANWHHAPPTAASIADDSGFTSRLRAAHSRGMEVERAIAADLGLRRDSTGTPYGRSSTCFSGTSAILRFGPHSEAIHIERGNVGRIGYFERTDLCTGPL